MKLGTWAYYAICLALFVVGVFFIIFSQMIASGADLLLLIAGSLLGTGIAGALSVKMSAEAESEFKSIIRNSFELYFDRGTTRGTLDKSTLDSFHVYYLSEMFEGSERKPVWKASYMSFGVPIGETVAKGQWKLTRPNGSVANYDTELIGLQGKVIIFAQCTDAKESTSVFVLNRNAMEGDRMYGIHHAVSWTNLERVSPCIFSKSPIADVKEIEDVGGTEKIRELANIYVERSGILDQMSEPKNFLSP